MLKSSFSSFSVLGNVSRLRCPFKRPSAHICYLFLSVSNNNKTLAGCLIFLIVAELIASIFAYVNLKAVQTFAQSEIAPQYSRSISACSALAACVDTAIALSVVVLLYRRRSETAFRRTSSIIDRIMMYTVGSGLLTAAFALAGFITFLTMPNNLIFIMVQEMLPKRESIWCGMLVFVS